MIYFERGSEKDNLTDNDLQAGLNIALQKLGEKNKVLVVPPDYTRGIIPGPES